MVYTFKKPEQKTLTTSLPHILVNRKEIKITMNVNMLAAGIIILSVISLAGGTTTTTNSHEIQAIVKEVVKDVLKNGTVASDGDILQALTDIEELGNKSNFLEKRVLSLERQNGEKDRIIQSMQLHIDELFGSGLRYENFQNDTSNPANVIFAADQSGTDSLTRKKRETALPNIAFSAYLKRTHSNMSPGETVKFNQVLLNDGHGYNQYTGVFTAPISGTYLFTFHFHSTVHTFVRLNVDGANIVDAVVNPHLINTLDKAMMAGNTVVIHVGIGQVVSVEVYDVSGEAASNDKYRLCTFSGFVLYPEHP